MDQRAEDLEALLRLANAFSQAGGGKVGAEPPRPQRELSTTCAAAFAMGLVRGRWGKVAPFGIPLDLGLGAALHLLAQSGALGPGTHTAEALAGSALSAYFTTWGASVGSRLKVGLPATAAAAGGEVVAADLPSSVDDARVVESIRSIIDS